MDGRQNGIETIARRQQPERLAGLNQQFLSLTPIATKQLQGTIAEIPLRPVVEPLVEEAAAK